MSHRGSMHVSVLGASEAFNRIKHQFTRTISVNLQASRHASAGQAISRSGRLCVLLLKCMLQISLFRSQLGNAGSWGDFLQHQWIRMDLPVNLYQNRPAIPLQVKYKNCRQNHTAQAHTHNNKNTENKASASQLHFLKIRCDVNMYSDVYITVHILLSSAFCCFLCMFCKQKTFCKSLGAYATNTSNSSDYSGIL